MESPLALESEGKEATPAREQEPSSITMSASIAITVNGQSRTAPAGASINDLLRELGLESGRVAVERNREIVPRSAWLETVLSEGDQFEIVHFVGGG